MHSNNFVSFTLNVRAVSRLLQFNNWHKITYQPHKLYVYERKSNLQTTPKSFLRSLRVFNVSIKNCFQVRTTTTQFKITSMQQTVNNELYLKQFSEVKLSY